MFYSVVSGENSAASVVQCLFQQYYSKHLFSAALGQLCFMQYSAYFSISYIESLYSAVLGQQRYLYYKCLFQDYYRSICIALLWDSSALCIISAYFSTTTEVFV
jgi:hypothetical protein